MNPKTTTAEKLAKYTTPIPETSCVVWVGTVNEHGYGYLKEGGKMIRAHKASYLLHKGPIPDGLVVCHSCDVPACVNPDHLFLGSRKDNMQDCLHKGRLAGRRHDNQAIPAELRTEIAMSDLTYAEIEKKYGVCQTTISKFKRQSSLMLVSGGI